VNNDMTKYEHDFWLPLFEQIDREGRPILCWTANGSLEKIRAYFTTEDSEWLFGRLMGAVTSYEMDGANGRTIIHHPAGSAGLPVEDL